MTRKSYPTKWTHEDFESLSWHDNHVHGIRIRNPEDTCEYELVLEIDHILEWITMPNTDVLRFVGAPATLTFHDVDKLAIDVALGFKEDFVIDEIERVDLAEAPDRTADMRNHRWQINMQSLVGRANRISFEARGFTQNLTKGPIGPQTGQSLGQDHAV